MPYEYFFEKKKKKETVDWLIEFVKICGNIWRETISKFDFFLLQFDDQKLCHYQIYSILTILILKLEISFLKFCNPKTKQLTDKNNKKKKEKK